METHNIPLRTHYSYLKKLECLKLASSLKMQLEPALPELISINDQQAVWKVNLSLTEPCYMRNFFGHNDDNLYIVHVNAKKFYYHWLFSSLFLESQHRSNHCVLLKDMPKDYKYQDAAKGFSLKISNPVPLALVAAQYDTKAPIIEFVNGVSRTMWLLVNGANSFPMEIHGEESAISLYEFAGIGQKPIAYAELVDSMISIKNQP